MAKDASFDIVSVTDMMEVDNAWQQTKKTMAGRYDFKGVDATIELDKSKGVFTVQAPSDFVVGQIIDILTGAMVRRKIDTQAVQWGDSQAASGNSVRKIGTICQGIDQDLAKRISKDIRDLKLKVKPTVEGDKLRVTSAKKDLLQEVISFLREQDYGIPLQFENYR